MIATVLICGLIVTNFAFIYLMLRWRDRYVDMARKIVDSAYFDNKWNDDLVQYCELVLKINDKRRS